MEDKEKIIELIRKCLALGDSSKNNQEGEIANALAAAKRLMDKHNLSMAEVAESRINKDGIVEVQRHESVQDTDEDHHRFESENIWRDNNMKTPKEIAAMIHEQIDSVAVLAISSQGAKHKTAGEYDMLARVLKNHALAIQDLAYDLGRVEPLAEFKDCGRVE
jgi:hypothetical protein